MNLQNWLPRLRQIAAWANGLLWFGLWLWLCIASYQDAGLGGLLAWTVLGGLVCLLLWLFFDRLFVQALEAWIFLVFVALAVAGFFTLVSLLWGVKL